MGAYLNVLYGKNLVDRVGKLFTGLELHNVLCADLDRLSGLWVAAGSGVAAGGGESAEADQGDLFISEHFDYKCRKFRGFVLHYQVFFFKKAGKCQCLQGFSCFSFSREDLLGFFGVI
jgi:hypothetical protein